MSDLGTARGSITIDVSQLEAARQAVQAFATGVNTNLTGINSAAVSASQGITSMAGAVRGLASAFGIAFGVQGLVQLG